MDYLCQKDQKTIIVNDLRLLTCYKSKRAGSSFPDRFSVILQLMHLGKLEGKLPSSIYSQPLN